MIFPTTKSFPPWSKSARSSILDLTGALIAPLSSSFAASASSSSVAVMVISTFFSYVDASVVEGLITNHRLETCYHIESRKNRWIWNVSQKLFHYMQPSSYTVFSPLSSILWLVAPLLESSHRKIILDFPWDKELLLPLGKSPQGMAHRGDCVWWEIES